jgi:hypothetical protein
VERIPISLTSERLLFQRKAPMVISALYYPFMASFKETPWREQSGASEYFPG